MKDQEQSDLPRMLHDLRQGAMQENDLYDTIHELGRGDYLEARPDIEKFLTHENPRFRYVAWKFSHNISIWTNIGRLPVAFLNQIPMGIADVWALPV